jgi:hypothetical protein
MGSNTHKSSEGEDNISFIGGKNNRFTRCEVHLADNDNRSNRHWLKISKCKAMKVDHCFFHQKESGGQFCNVSFDPEGNDVEEGPLFEYNYFLHQNFGRHVPPEKYGDAGGEAIQMGHSKQSRIFFRAIFRFNILEQCNGNGETITNKSSGNIYINNSFVNNNGTLTLRHGDSTAVIGNCFEACGLRVGGADNLIANNHFTLNSNDSEARRPLVIMNGDRERPTEQKGFRERVVNNDIMLNTFANGIGTADQIVYWGRSSNPLKPTGNRFRGNIITAQTGVLLEFDNGATASGNTISDNIAFVTGDAGFGDLSTRMATRIDPLLILEDGNNNDGIFRLKSDSPARNKFPGTPFSSLTNVDIFGVTRSINTDAGCCQFGVQSTARPKKRITPEDVGPKATTDLGKSPPWNPNSEGENWVTLFGD